GLTAWSRARESAARRSIRADSCQRVPPTRRWRVLISRDAGRESPDLKIHRGRSGRGRGGTSMAIAIVAAYLIGSIPFALICARRWGGADLRRIGSGNVGAANVMRASGVTVGVVVAALGTAKGAARVWLAEQLAPGPVLPAAAGLAAIVGHVYPVWLRFRGGKGVATACGVFSVLTPLALPPALAIFAIAVWLTKYISLGSLLAS